MIEITGPVAFGLVVGWITYRTIRRRQGHAALSDIAGVIGAVGGGAITSLFGADTSAFHLYCIGLACGFFGYFITALALNGQPNVAGWMMEDR
jgi:uncharacterized membrane protein YeaQ/YmgE (transglycosylase-associated protein family)